MKKTRLASQLKGVFSVALLGVLALSGSPSPPVHAEPGSWFRSPSNLGAARRLAKEQGKPVLILLR